MHLCIPLLNLVQSKESLFSDFEILSLNLQLEMVDQRRYLLLHHLLLLHLAQLLDQPVLQLQQLRVLVQVARDCELALEPLALGLHLCCVGHCRLVLKLG